MATFLHPGIVYGPVVSRRLGISLGLNLSPTDGKVCTFDCLYCECGLNAERRPTLPLPTAAELAAELRTTLTRLRGEGTVPDSITMAGNGEPTANPEFPQIVDVTLALRDELAPAARVSVLTNATMLGRPDVVAALARVDDAICKLDTVDPAYVALLDRPRPGYDVREVVRQLEAFPGHLTIQTMFLGGTWEGHDMTNTGEGLVGPWLEALRRIAPQAVTVYTIARDTPVATLRKALPEELDAIAARVRELGIACSVSY